MTPLLLLLLLLLAALLLCLPGAATSASPPICIVGGGISGSSLAHFLKHYTCNSSSSPLTCLDDIHVFERRGHLGGRMATVTIGGDVFEAGASVIHPKNLHALRFASLLNLPHKPKPSRNDDDSWIGIWDGERFVFQTPRPPPNSSSWIWRKVYSLLNLVVVFRRYGFSLLRMNGFVKRMLERFMSYYKELEARPVFETVEEMLKWSELYGLTQRTLQEELTMAGLSPRLIAEFVTMITRINYGQSASINGLAGAVSLAGSGGGLWSVQGGNWQIAAGLINHSNVSLHLHEEITSISNVGGSYELKSKTGNHYKCEVTVIATPLDEVSIKFTPPVSIPPRKLQHTFATFVRGLLNPEYFGLKSASEIPKLVGTVEKPDIPFSSVSVLKEHTEDDKTYKMFSRAPVGDDLLDQIFSTRKETIQFNWPAYPHFEAPEVFAPIILDGLHLYYTNSFENAASTIETSAVAAENVARLITSRLSLSPPDFPDVKIINSNQEEILNDDL